METKCKTCLGCNRLEDRNFKEVYRCENHMRGAEDEQSRNSIQVTKLEPIHKRMQKK
mgnify:FL=1